MDVATILAPSSVRCEAQVTSKKQALELLSQMLATAAGHSKPAAVFHGLAARERLGSTGLGASVAMPHTRLAGVERMVGGFLRLREPVSFDSADGLPVDLLFGLVVPEGSNPAQLRAIRELVKKLRDPGLQKKLHGTDDPGTLYALLTETLTVDRPSPVQRTTGG